MYTFPKRHTITNMTAIIDMIYEKFPEPPVSTVLLQFSRDQLDPYANSTYKNDTTHDLLVDNIKQINLLVEKGMWGGKVKVVEAGSRKLEEAGNPFYARYSTIAGGIMNLFLAIEADIFIGTAISTYSAVAVNARYYRERKENYFYHPDGMYLVPPENSTRPFYFELF